jgi:predicted phage gp36 major capsid-like protein
MDASNVAAGGRPLLAQGKDDLEAVKFAPVFWGGNEPIGIVTALTGVTASTVPSTTADTFAFNDLYKVHGALPARYRHAGLVAGEQPVLEPGPADGAEQHGVERPGRRPAGELLGKPVYEAEAMDGVINATVDNLMAMFGDFSNYVIADRIGMTSTSSRTCSASNRRPTGQSGWFAHYRVGADSVNDAAFRVYNVT